MPSNKQKHHIPVPGKEAHPIDVSLALDQTKAFEHLNQLALKPLDLTDDKIITPERFQQYWLQAPHFDCYYATQRVNDAVLEQLQLLADELKLVKNFDAQLRGAAMNQVFGFESEESPVLHTALRNIHNNKNMERFGPIAAYAAKQAQDELQKLKTFISSIESKSLTSETGEPFQELIVIGIGGSDLGPRALYHALQPYQKRKVHFVSNVDPDDVGNLEKHIQDPHRTLVAVISKSGTTLETLTNEALIYERLFKRHNIPKKKHFISITTPGSPMDDPSKYLQCFHLFDWVGGRVSATSMVGGVTLAFAFGMSVFEGLLQGAHQMDLHARNPNIRINMPLLNALLTVWNHNFLGYHTWAILPYAQLLQRYPAHLQQLFMESNGKCIRRDGTLLFDAHHPDRVRYRTCPVVFGEPGTNGQHSFYQLLHQHPGRECFHEFIGFLHNSFETDIALEGSTSRNKLVANLLAQVLAFAKGKQSDNLNNLCPGNRPSTLLIGNKLTSESLGALLAYHESVTAYLGYIWGINSWDQEGVQIGKTLTKQLLRSLADRSLSTPEDRVTLQSWIETLLTP